jgi:hypothetical protein
MKVIIAGSRDFNDYEFLKKHCDEILKFQATVEIVSGGARGADRLGERYAMEKGYPITVFAADWVKYGKPAGVIRNEEMAVYADALIAFWDGSSPGTKHMIDTARRYGIRSKTINYGSK